MTKFKVGDKVRVRKNLIPNKKYGNVNFIHIMKNMCGKIATIKGVSNNGNNLCLKEFDYYWSPEMLEPVKDDKIKELKGEK